MVCDTNMLLKQRDVFDSLLQNGGWSVVVPAGGLYSLMPIASDRANPLGVAITCLLSLSRQAVPDGMLARDALQSVRTAILDDKTVRIATDSGDDVTQEFLSENMSGDEQENVRRSEESIIGVARRQSDLNRQPSGSQQSNSEARPAVLVTEDKAMRMKAATAGVAAIATSMMKKLLVPSRKALEPDQLPSQ
jgi:hypothetical protein